MYKIPAPDANKRRPQAAIGSERAARLTATKNLAPGRTMAPQDNQDLDLALVDSWLNSEGATASPLPRMLVTIGSNRVSHLAALENLHPTQNSADNKIIEGPKATMYKAPTANESQSRPQAAIGSERAARLAVIENLDSGPTMTGDNLNLDLPLADGWPNSGAGGTPAPPRALGAIGTERAAPLAPLRCLNLSRPMIGDDDDLSFSGDPETHWAGKSMLPRWQNDPQSEVGPRSGHTFFSLPPEEAAAPTLANQRKLDSMPQPVLVPQPDRNPLSTPTLIPTLAAGPEGLYLLLTKTPVQAESSRPSQLPEWYGKTELSPRPVLPSPLALCAERALEDLQYFQAKNHRLAERILSQMPNEQGRQQFHHELLRRQLSNEQQLTSFLEGMLSQTQTAPEARGLWVSWFGNGEDTAAAGGEGGGLPSAGI